MSDKSAKKRAPKAAQQGVLGTLSSTRPERVGRARKGATRSSRTATAGTDPARPRASAAKSSGAATKPSAAATKSAKAAKPSAPPPPPERDGRRSGPPSGAELATTVVKAAGEVAAIGVGAGARALKRAAQRVPRP
jgi:hypothetical protein